VQLGVIKSLQRTTLAELIAFQLRPAVLPELPIESRSA
jgi:hypothetical protein